MSASGKTLPEHDAKIARISFGAVWSHYISIFVEAPDYRSDAGELSGSPGSGHTAFQPSCPSRGPDKIPRESRFKSQSANRDCSLNDRVAAGVCVSTVLLLHESRGCDGATGPMTLTLAMNEC